MSYVVALASWSMLGLGIVFFVAQVVAREVGHFCARRFAREQEPDGVGILVGGMLGLMAFVLGLTLSFANSRFAERRAGALEEANAIGTAWLRAQSLDHPRAAAIGNMLEEYARLRMEFVSAPRDTVLLDSITARTSAMQTEIWGHYTALSRERIDPLISGLMTSLNETFDAGTAERFSFSSPLPEVLFWLLTLMALMGMGGLGYQLGLRGRAHRALATLLTSLWTVVIVGILDLAAPRIGMMRPGIQVYEWTIQGFQGGVRIPPLPAGK